MNQCRKPPCLAPITSPSLNYSLSHANVSGKKKIQKNVYGHLVSACFIIVHLIFTLRGYSVKNLYYTGVYSHSAKNETLLDDFLCETK